MNYRLAYSLGFHPWEDAANDPPFVRKATELFAREERAKVIGDQTTRQGLRRSDLSAARLEEELGSRHSIRGSSRSLAALPASTTRRGAHTDRLHRVLQVLACRNDP